MTVATKRKGKGKPTQPRARRRLRGPAEAPGPGGGDELAGRAERIRAHLAAAGRAERLKKKARGSELSHYRGAGEELLGAREQLARENNGSSYGHWKDWLHDNFALSERPHRRSIAILMTDSHPQDHRTTLRRFG
jgi:hypothetical protein